MRTAVRLAAIALSLVSFGASAQVAASASTVPNIDIVKETARFINDSQINVVLHVQCTGGNGTSLLTVNVTQTASQSANGTAGAGNGYETVRCDGTRHKLAVVVATNFGPGATGFLNLGKATATASFYMGQTTYPPTGSATLTDGPETISIVA